MASLSPLQMEHEQIRYRDNHTPTPIAPRLLQDLQETYTHAYMYKHTYEYVCVCIYIRGLHGLKTEARTRPVPEIVWPNPTRPERHG